MFDRGENVDFRRGFIIVIDGVSIWLLGLLMKAYVNETDLPWLSLEAFFRSVTAFSTRWLSSPLAGPAELLATVGAALIIGGPMVDLLIRPLLRRSGVTAAVSRRVQTPQWHRRLRNWYRR